MFVLEREGIDLPQHFVEWSATHPQASGLLNIVLTEAMYKNSPDPELQAAAMDAATIREKQGIFPAIALFVQDESGELPKRVAELAMDRSITPDQMDLAKQMNQGYGLLGLRGNQPHQSKLFPSDQFVANDAGSVNPPSVK